MGVGYIVGWRASAMLGACGLLWVLVLIPLIYAFGEFITTPIYPGNIPISQMSPLHV